LLAGGSLKRRKIMSRVHEELKQHIHGDLCSAVNNAIIDIKIHHKDISGESAEQQAKIIEARRRKHCPTWEEIIELLTQCHDEMYSCTKPYKRY
jgi:hypothetical protein